MAKQTINIGSGELTGDGESLRAAFKKINENFDENYASLADLTAGNYEGQFKGSVFGDDSSLLIDGPNNTFNFDGTIKGDIVPALDSEYDLGSPSRRWKDLFLSGTTLDLGGLKLRYRNNGLQIGIDILGGESPDLFNSGVNSSVWKPAGSVPAYVIWDEDGNYVKDNDVISDTAYIEISFNQSRDTIGFKDAVLAVKSGNGHSLVDPEQYNGTAYTNVLRRPPYEVTHAGDPIFSPRKGNYAPGDPIPQSEEYGVIIIPVTESPVEAGVISGTQTYTYQGQTYFITDMYIYAHAFPVEAPLQGDSSYNAASGDSWTEEGGAPTSVSDAIDALAARTPPEEAIIPAENVQGGLFDLTGDDSTTRTVTQGSTVQIIGGDRITTASDADGNIVVNTTDLHINVATDDSTIVQIGMDDTLQILGGNNVDTTIDADGIVTVALPSTISGSFEGSIRGDVIGSVFADDSSVIIDGVSGKLYGSLTGDVIGSVFSDDSSLLVDGIDRIFYGDLHGSVFAQDSTMMINAEDGTIDASLLVGTLPALDGSALTGVSGGGGGTGDIQGSVFGDDSTLLVDGVNSTINSSALTKPIDLDDGEEVRFGTDNDMLIYHSGVTGVIKNTTGTLVLQGGTVRIQDGGLAQSAFSASNGIATLYHLNSTKLETTTDGVAVTGRITGLTDPTAAQDAATKAYVDANAGGSGLQSRSTATGNTNSLADAAEADLDITGFKSYALLTITTDRAARVRLYVSAATRTADASRAEGVDPTSDAGLIAEVITTGNETVTISPGAYGFNLESTPTTTIPCRVTNKSGGTATVQVTLNILQLEA